VLTAKVPSALPAKPGPTNKAPTELLRPLLVSAVGAGLLLDMSARSVRRMNSAGTLGPRPVMCGASPKWRVGELEKWVESGCPDRRTWDRLSKESDG
jgi:predicted DNA-binding transcriptional regulator AlpA